MRKLSIVVALAFASTSAFAAFWGKGNQDALGNVINDESMSYVGTGLGDERPANNIYGSLSGPDAIDGFRVGGMSPDFSVNADEEGSILVKTGVRR